MPIAKFYQTCILIIFISVEIFGQQNVNKDSANLAHNYWNKIVPKSVTSKNDFLYSGIDNYLEMDYPDEYAKSLKYLLTTHNGDIFESGEQQYLTIPRSAGRSFIAIYAITPANDTLLIGKKDFIVKNVPYPVVKMNNVVIKDNDRIDRRLFFTGDSLRLFFTDDIPESDQWYRVESFSMGYSYGGVYISEDNKGALFNEKVLGMITRIHPGEDVVIKINSISPSGILRFLPIVRFILY